MTPVRNAKFICFDIKNASAKPKEKATYNNKKWTIWEILILLVHALQARPAAADGA